MANFSDKSIRVHNKFCICYRVTTLLENLKMLGKCKEIDQNSRNCQGKNFVGENVYCYLNTWGYTATPVFSSTVVEQYE